jgi:hypothetical protein
MEALIPCIDDIEEVIKSLPKDDNGNLVNYKIVESLPTLIGTYNFIENNMIQDRERLYEVKKNEWRILRKPKLEELDVEFMKSIEENNLSRKEEIILKKIQLRDITNIDISNLTNKELEDFIPDILKN